MLAFCRGLVLVYLYKTHVQKHKTFMCIWVCWYFVCQTILSKLNFLSSPEFAAYFFFCYISVCLSFLLLFLLLIGHLLFVHAAHPPLPLISLGVTLRFGLTWQRRTQDHLYSICEVSLVASILHTCCWATKECCTTIPHPHLVRNMKAWTSSQKHKRYQPLPVVCTEDFGPAYV